jgi:hypothetical protein
MIDACRVPLAGRGWHGCFCSLMCVRSFMIIEGYDVFFKDLHKYYHPRADCYDTANHLDKKTGQFDLLGFIKSVKCSKYHNSSYFSRSRSVSGTQLLIKETKDYVVCLNIEPNDDALDSFLITPLR